MGINKFSAQTIWAVLSICMCFSARLGFSGDQKGLKFDIGTSTSPVSEGFVRVPPDATYSRNRGFGWEGDHPLGFDVEKPEVDPAWEQPSGQVVPENYLIHKEHSELTRDGVKSTRDIQFRVDLPNGDYQVALTIGRLDAPVCSLQIYINDRLEATDFDAKHWISRRRPDAQYGFPRRIRRTVKVDRGVLTIRLHGDDSGFRQRFDREYDKLALGSYLEGTYFGGVFRIGRSLGMDSFVDNVKPTRGDISIWGKSPFHLNRVWVWQDIGGPFRESALCGVEIYPSIDRVLEWKDGRLTTTSGNPLMNRAVALFNEGKWRDAENAFAAVADPYARAQGWLWLAGRPEFEEEQRLIPKAIEVLQQLAQQNPNDYRVKEDLENAKRLARCMYRFVHRSERQRAYTELILAAGEVNSLQPDDPLYNKSRIYAGRAMYMIIPHRWTYAAGVGRQYFEELERAGFANNRFVRWFLHDEWSPHDPDWVFPDYSQQRLGAPAWAAEVFEAFNREIDLGEWWIHNRQQPDGSLGGGWGDDVEILRSLGAFVSVCPDSSPDLLQGIRKVVDGVWDCGSIDREAGYFGEVDDTEHSGEWTGDTLTAMVRLDYGNPVYVERALKTAKLMRDLWMDYTTDGLFLMRSNFVGSTGVGPPGTNNDSRINFRSASPARSVLAYNNLQPLQSLYLDWAETWWKCSMSSARGKPAGIIPQEIGYPSGLIGGANSPNWYTAGKGPGSENYDWEGAAGYLNYIVDLFVLARELTGDDKYLEPLRLQAEFVEKHLPVSVRESVFFQQSRLHPSLWESLEPGSHAWIAARLATWPAQWQSLQRTLHPKQASSEKMVDRLDDVAKRARDEISGARRRIPHTTSEAMATDRIHFPGMGNAARIMSGSAEHGEGSLVTYRGLGRSFAAVLLRADAEQVRVALYNFDTVAKEAGMIPWVLQQGDEYEFTYGVDSNADTLPEKIVETRRIRVNSPAPEIAFKVDGRTQLVLDVRRIASSKQRQLLADLAISSADIHFRSDFGKIDVAIHNIGGAAARDTTIVLLDEQQKEIGRQFLPHIAPPTNLDPQIVRVGFAIDYRKALGKSFTAVLDPDQRQTEITVANNRATAVCPQQVPPRRIHSHP